MMVDYFQPEPEYKAWFRKEQGRYLKRARLSAGLSVRDLAERTGVDIRWVERGEVSVSMKNLAFLIRLYGVPFEQFTEWEQEAEVKLRKMIPPRLLH